jgi:hypothetical protein
VTTRPPPLPPLKERLRKPVQELSIGSPVISVELYAKLAEVNDHVIRRFVATFPRPGRMWGDPDVNAMRIMLGAALEQAATRALETVTSVTIPPLPKDIPRDTSIGPWPEDEPTAPMRRDQKPHG